MAIKVLINAIGQQLIADVKQVENSDTNEVIAYWLREPRVLHFVANEEGPGVNVRFLDTCIAAVNTEYSVRADHIVSILDPKEEIEKSYSDLVFPDALASAVVEGEE